MELTEAALRAIIREELASHKHPCRFSSVADEDTKLFGDYVHSVSRLGNGDTDAGFDLMRENNLWLKSMRESGGWASKIFYGAIISAMVGAFLMVIWEGIKKALMK